MLISSLAGPHMLRREEAEIRRVLAAATKPIVVYSYTHPGEASVEALARWGGLVPEPGPGRPGGSGLCRRRAGGIDGAVLRFSIQIPGAPELGQVGGQDAPGRGRRVLLGLGS